MTAAMADPAAGGADGRVPRFDDVSVGTMLPEQTFQLRRVDLVRYAGASGDFNPIHWNPRFATEVGLPDVIAHGMLTMAEAARVVTDWVVDPGAVLEYGVRFTRPVVVPDDDLGASLVVSGEITELTADARTAVVSLTATANGQTVLARARAVVRLR
ncbi:MAG: MaoC/PaaZ C-terminal domain-containing protein [bacterium]